MSNEIFNNSMQNAGYIGSEGASAEHVNEARQRFMIVNQGRLMRLKEGLQLKQQNCLDLLPLLFHVNHPGLPGYVESPDTPIGIAFYQPTDSIVKLAQAVSRLPLTQSMPLTRPQLSAMYLMGSSGSIGQSTNSDLDIWVCHQSDLTTAQLKLLDDKGRLISQWANGFNLEVHFFTMSASHFDGNSQQSITGENCGSTQRVLLLDEFYRTAQLIAGVPPFWWFVPSEQEANYDSVKQKLFEAGLLNSGEVTDFGGIQTLDAGEFIGAGMWQVYKAIDSPFKSVLKLILLEIYAGEFPKIRSLSHEFKESVYKMHLSLNDLDPYVMLYQRIEDYLIQRDEVERLNLLRKCFYFKVGVSLSKTTRAASWRRELLALMVQQWQWDSHQIRHLDNFRQWSVGDVMRERRLLIAELTRSYRFLTEFANEHHTAHIMSQKDLLILSRKLHAAFDRRPGKIDFITIGLDIDLSQEKVRIYQRESKQKNAPPLWAAYNQAISDQESIAPLKYSNGLLETLLWCHLNGLLSAHLHIPVQPLAGKIGDFEVRMTIASMRQHLPLPMPKVDPFAFHQPASITKVILFINLGRDPLSHLSAKGLQKISERSNSLDFSGLRENLVLSLDMVIINTWGEVVVERFSDDDVTANALQALINKLNKQHHKTLPELTCVCHNETRPQAIAKRVKDLFLDAMNTLCDAGAPSNTRFVFNQSEHLILFQYNQRVTHFIKLNSEIELLQHLSTEQEEYSAIVVDRHFSFSKAWFKALLRVHRPGMISLSFESVGTKIITRMIDEQGSFVQYSSQNTSLSNLMAPLIRFIKVTEHRQRNMEEFRVGPNRTLQCFEFRKENGKFEHKKIPLNHILKQGRFISIQASVELNPGHGYSYTIVCNDKEFSSQVLGDKLYTAVASYILGVRSAGQRYPAYITDLALSETLVEQLPFGRAQSKHYLEMKLRIERKINQAMQLL